MKYADIIAHKDRRIEEAGKPADDPHGALFPFQREIVRWAIRKGRAAVFADCGMGKTPIQIEWVRQQAAPRLIVAPLAVAGQTIALARDLLGLEVTEVADTSAAPTQITNYEKLHRFDPAAYAAVVLDESSILKSLDGKTRTRLLREWTVPPVRLCCTATPAPNDIAELANHAEFLGVASRVEMLAEFFVHDDEGWRLKGHAREAFWRWIAQWACFARSPSDLGFADEGFLLPPLEITDDVVPVTWRPPGSLFADATGGVRGRLGARRGSIQERVARTADLVRASGGPWLVWCGLNEESSRLADMIGEEAVEVSGADTDEEKIEKEARWRAGRARVLITKPRIFGFGMNWQHCGQMAFLGIGDSYEQYYQAIRRCWRFGRHDPVRVHIVISDAETGVAANVRAKEAVASQLSEEVIRSVREDQIREIKGATIQPEYRTGEASGDGWRLLLGDCVDRLRELPEASVGLSVFSPPFAALFTYSASPRDMGNCRDHEGFFASFAHFTPELLRVTMPGRRAAVHVAQVSTTKATHGVIGWIDFRARVVQEFVRAGWVYDGEIVIDKDPQAQAIRTHSKALLFVQKERDSAWLRPAMADYMLLFRAPGDNPEPVHSDVDNEEWILWARPIWYGIDESDTLNAAAAREDKDERHICLAAGSLVLTREHGYLEIEEVEVGDYVLTHRGRWMPVLAKMCNGIAETVRVCGQGVADLRVTPEHNLWTRAATGPRAKAAARETEPSWAKASAVLGSYLNLRLPPEESSPLTADEWWIVGRWLGDGHRGGHRRSGIRGGMGQFYISCAHEEAPALIARLGSHAGHAAKVTATQIALVGLRQEVRDVLNRCGEGAAAKRLPGEAVALGKEMAASLLDGYLSADGYHAERYDRHAASSVSRALLLGMALIAQRARGVVASVYAGRPEREGVIEGRRVSMRQDWIFAFRGSDGYRQSGWIDEEGAWKKVRKIEIAGEAEVWDLAVAEDSSFTAEGAIVHNCPLQLGVVERCVRLWSNPGDLICDPFAGIGSTGVVALRRDRRFVGIELKEAYHRCAAKNLDEAKRQLSLF